MARRKKVYEPKLTSKRSTTGIHYFLDRKENGERKTTRVKQEPCRCKRRNGAFEASKCEHWRVAQTELDRWKQAGCPMALTKDSDFESAAEWWLDVVAKHRAYKTHKSYKSTIDLVREFGPADLRMLVDRKWLFEFRAWLGLEREIKREGKDPIKRQRNHGTVNVHLRNVIAFLNDCAEDGRIAPFATMKGLLYPTTYRYSILTQAEVDRCLACETMQEGSYSIRLLKLYYYTGMRLGELVWLTWDYVTTDRILIRKRSDWTPKWGIERDIPISHKIMDLLEGLRNRSAELGSEYVFCADNGKRLDEDNVRRGIKALYTKCECVGTHTDENIGVHTIRHTFASKLVNELRTPLPIAMKLLGHKNIKTTERYLHAQFEGIVEALAAL